MKRSREAEDELDSDYPSTDDETNDRSDLVDPDPDDHHTAKFAILDPSEHAPTSKFTMKCYLPGHQEGMAFGSYDEYQSHYHKAHTNRCLECRSNFPSAHLLSIHIEECHDSFAAVRRDRGEHTYSCFVEGCERKCLTPQKRRLHLIDKHMYPRNFYFAVTKTGIDGRRSLLVDGNHGKGRRRGASTTSKTDVKATRHARRRSSQTDGSPSQNGSPGRAKNGDTTAPPGADNKMDTGGPASKVDTEMEGLAGAMAALQFVPYSIRFGRGGGKAGFSKR
ncbi:hypothetical protein SODALDRAFT_278025 [Sodiomyces alkalinus F11]|uniref:C2H2-type domain-containing protein n=1 Tax=Sodiomyces alkalinus (strain CBS 110278 / VKM F-3762 / F11) TaxID=1314773 RepID=A0A3N2PVJ3_SODAK|nr:hypothetical protein SODALDRAFT_278025 [Sodiomyces alkalinus F11]ROT38504.1 hypothetical protein SODALDRAFT_278025 [Sodiomyces alkalinus F11]